MKMRLGTLLLANLLVMAASSLANAESWVFNCTQGPIAKKLVIQTAVAPTSGEYELDGLYDAMKLEGQLDRTDIGAGEETVLAMLDQSNPRRQVVVQKVTTIGAIAKGQYIDLVKRPVELSDLACELTDYLQ